MKKLDYKLDVWGSTVMFQVVEMDESQRCDSTRSMCYVATNLINIRSFIHPGISASDVFLKGCNSEYDNNVLMLTFNSRNEALDYATKVEAALAEWGENGGFNECKPKPKPVSISEMHDDDISFVYLIDSTAGEVREVKNNQARSYVLHANKLGLAFLDYEVAKRQLERMEAIVRVNDAIDKFNSKLEGSAFLSIYYNETCKSFCCHVNSPDAVTQTILSKIKPSYGGLDTFIDNHFEDLKLIFGVNDDN